MSKSHITVTSSEDNTIFNFRIEAEVPLTLEDIVEAWYKWLGGIEPKEKSDEP